MKPHHCPLCGDGKDLPPGYIFKPNDKQLIYPYLHHYASTGQGCCKHIFVEEVYKKDPSKLLGNDCDERYFFTTRTKCSTKSTPPSARNNRTVRRDGCAQQPHSGTWVSKMQKEDIKSDDGNLIGHKTRLYYQKIPGTNSGYTMYEYELSQSYTSSSSDKEERVLCCVKTSPKKRKAEAAAAAAKAASKQAHHENGGAIDKSRADVVSPANAAAVTAANATRRKHSSAAAEASPEGRAHKATNVASGEEWMNWDWKKIKANANYIKFT